MDTSLNFSGVTHLVIKTGYDVPPFHDLFGIEAALRTHRELLDGSVTVIYSCAAFRQLGIHVPCPFGFQLPSHAISASRPSKQSLVHPDEATKREADAYAAEIESVTDKIMNAAVDRPFHEYGLAALRIRRALEAGPNKTDARRRVNSCEETLALAKLWEGRPLNPEREMDYEAFCEVEKEMASKTLGEGERSYCAVCDKAKYYKHMMTGFASYDDRLRETEAVVAALGGAKAAEGLCLKLGQSIGRRAFEILDILRAEGFVYCHPEGLRGLRLVKTEERKILVLKYYC